jgi:hypothetical protein
VKRKPFIVQCERCGNEQPVSRGGHFRDEDYLELHHDYMALEQAYRREVAMLERRLASARERIDQLRELVVQDLPTEQATPAHVPETETENPFA